MRTPEFESLRVIFRGVSGKDVEVRRRSLVIGDELLHVFGITIVVSAKPSQIILGRRVSKSALFRVQALAIVIELSIKPLLQVIA